MEQTRWALETFGVASHNLGQPTLPSMKLSYDVLFAIVELQSLVGDISGLSAMSLTCHTLRDFAIKRIFDREITLHNDEVVVSFLRFMLGDEGQRFSLLRRSLKIDTGCLSEPAAGDLVEIITRTTHLERLVLVNADRILASHPNLPRAFASLTCIKHLEVSISNGQDLSQCANFFKYMRSRLLTVRLDLPSILQRWDHGSVHNVLSDPICLLQNSTSTLTEFRGTHLEAKCSTTTIYPHVKRLHITTALLPAIRPYIQSFPNVKSLDLSWGLGMYDSVALMNMSMQQDLGCWPGLDELRGTLTDLYILSLRCEVKSLHVLTSRRHGESNLGHLTGVLFRARPASLKMDVDSGAFCGNCDDRLSVVFNDSEASQFVKALDLDVVLQGEDVESEGLDNLLMSVIDTISTLPLESFKLRFIYVQREMDPSTESKIQSWNGARHVQRSSPLLTALAVERCEARSYWNPRVD